MSGQRVQEILSRCRTPDKTCRTMPIILLPSTASTAVPITLVPSTTSAAEQVLSCL